MAVHVLILVTTRFVLTVLVHITLQPEQLLRSTATRGVCAFAVSVEIPPLKQPRLAAIKPAL